MTGADPRRDGDAVAGGGPVRQVAEIALGARLAFAGGRESWARVAMTAVGVGLGVALLLVAVSVPAVLQARDERGSARSDLGRYAADRPPAADTLLVGDADTSYRDRSIRGRVLQPEGPDAPRPPGVDRLPGPGEVVVSPALAELLSSGEGALLRPRLGRRIAGIIGDAGLVAPNELAFYLGSDRLVHERNGVHRLDRFGPGGQGEPLDPVLLLLVVIAFVVLLLPVAVFIATAVRFGGERRDRRLAALRLVGADSRMVRRIAAGEALLGAVLGVLAGAVLFLAGRQVVERFTLWELSVFAADVRPDPILALLIAVSVPALAVLVTLTALRTIVIEPLGVVRRSGTGRRRLTWRLVLPVVGLALLYPLFGAVGSADAGFNRYQVAAGTVLLLVGVAALLPWLIETLVRRLGGGGVPWQLAVRRLQLDSGTSARVVNGIAVAVAGAIGLQMLFTGVDDDYTERTGAEPGRAQLAAQFTPGPEDPGTSEIAARFGAVPGVRSALAVTQVELSGTRPGAPGDDSPSSSLTMGDCAALRELVVLSRCADGDVFLAGTPSAAGMPVPGGQVELGFRYGPDDGPPLPRWTVPATARTAEPRPDPTGAIHAGVFATPSALRGVQLRDQRALLYLRLDPDRPETVEHLRNAAATVHPLLATYAVHATTENRRFANIRRGLFVGVVAVLALIGASMLVTGLEQLRERRRLLAVLVAFGTRRSTLSWSVFWQTAVPVLLGLVLAVGAGAGLGVVLLRIVSQPVRFNWPVTAGIAGAGAAVVLLVTALTMPALWRLMRPDGLRTE
jgi:hypothetical protein